ncbi:MAG TPA: hypothetical protein VGL56_19620 [Fimbriimonadaceae bacterium]|jgi:hypothetical protein
MFKLPQLAEEVLYFEKFTKVRKSCNMSSPFYQSAHIVVGKTKLVISLGPQAFSYMRLGRMSALELEFRYELSKVGFIAVNDDGKANVALSVPAANETVPSAWLVRSKDASSLEHYLSLGGSPTNAGNLP